MTLRREVRARLERLATRFGTPLALAFTAIAVAIRWALDPVLGDTYPLATLYGAVAAAAWLGGQGRGVLAAITGYLAADYLFIEPRGRFGFAETASFVAALTYILTCAIVIALGNAVRTARREAHDRDELLRVTLAGIGDSVVTTDMSGRVMALNPAAETLLGWSEREARDQLLSDVVHVVDEGSRAPIENPATQVLHRGRVVGLSERSVLIGRDGSERPIDDGAAPLRDEQGNIVGSVLMFRDVSDRRLAEIAVERCERELADFFNNASIALHWIGPDGTIVRANRAELEMLGYSHDEYVGRHVSRFHVDRDASDDLLARVFQGDTVVRFPARMRCKDGSIKKVLIDSSSFWDEGRLVHSCCFMFDVTEQKRVEETRSLLAAIVAASDDAIVSKTLDGIILSWNEGPTPVRLFAGGSRRATRRCDHPPGTARGRTPDPAADQAGGPRRSLRDHPVDSGRPARRCVAHHLTRSR